MSTSSTMSGAAQLFAVEAALPEHLLGYQFCDFAARTCAGIDQALPMIGLITIGTWRAETTTASWFLPPRGLPM